MRLILCLLVFSATAFADYKDFYFNKQAMKSSIDIGLYNPSIKRNSFATSSHIKTAVKARTFKQKLTHFDERENTTFKQRYYVNDTYALNSHSPTLLFICGESTCHSSSVTRGVIVQYAKSLKANIIALEHRYYGRSQPFKELTTKNMAYLSTDEAVEDLAYFQKKMIKSHSLHGKWVAIGGSYPGSLAAYYRQKYPNFVVGALASSAPVRAKANFDEYDAHVTKVVGPRCASLMNEAVREIEAAANDEVRMSEIRAMFNAQKITGTADFLYVVADIGAIAAQYGYVTKFCKDLSTASSALEGYAKFAKQIMSAWGMKPESISLSSATSLDPADYEEGFGMRQWLYQSCTEYGYWQVAHPTQSTRSSLIDLEYHNEACNKLFGIKDAVDTNHINNTFYKPLLNKSLSSNILFTNGSTDPWMNLSLLPTDNANSSNLYLLISGAAHCDDLGSSKESDSRDLKASRAIFYEMMKEWL